MSCHGNKPENLISREITSAIGRLQEIEFAARQIDVRDSDNPDTLEAMKRLAVNAADACDWIFAAIAKAADIGAAHLDAVSHPCRWGIEGDLEFQISERIEKLNEPDDSEFGSPRRRRGDATQQLLGTLSHTLQGTGGAR